MEFLYSIGKEEMKMNFQIKKIPPYHIAYMRSVGQYGLRNAKTMQSLKEWAHSNNLMTAEAIIFGIPQDDPQMTLAENCRYDACIVIAEDYVIDGALEGEFAGGNYAVFVVVHTAEAIQKAYEEIFPELQKSGYTADRKPIVERYTLEMVDSHRCEICVPIIQ